MTEQERQQKIEENKAAIAELEAEIRRLKGPRSIGELVTEPFYGFEYDRNARKHLPGKYRLMPCV